MKKTVLVTGANGFIGSNLVIALKRKGNLEVIEHDIDSPPDLLEVNLGKVEVIYHLAGVNRPERVEAFTESNLNLTRKICDTLLRLKRLPRLVFTSSTQATQDNPYGLSKRQAEEAIFDFSQVTGTPVYVFRLPGVFGKWCRPNYNSVVATFCHNIARNHSIEITDPTKELKLVYIDDVVKALIDVLDGHSPIYNDRYCSVEPVYMITLGMLAETIRGFRESRISLAVPEVGNHFVHDLYATYLSYLPTNSFAYDLTLRRDPRGELAELLKSPNIGQIFVSRTRPGITRGHHYHDTKVEKFVVLEGEGVIRFRHILCGDVIEYPVSGREFRVVDIPPGYTHSIENIGQNDLIVLFWADEIFNPDIPDTFGMNV